MSDDDNDGRSKREIKRSKMRRAGDRSASLAMALMKLPEQTIKKLDVDEALRDAIDRARRIESHIARRRAERTLAGDLRRFEDDLPGLEEQLATIEETGNPDAQLLHLGEQLRTRLIAEGMGAAKALPPGDDAELARMIDAAQRERDTGRPPGAARALFRHVVDRLKTQRANARLAASESDDA